eukprot:gene5691-6575_t
MSIKSPLSSSSPSAENDIHAYTGDSGQVLAAKELLVGLVAEAHVSIQRSTPAPLPKPPSFVSGKSKDLLPPLLHKTSFSSNSVDEQHSVITDSSSIEGSILNKTSSENEFELESQQSTWKHASTSSNPSTTHINWGAKCRSDTSTAAHASTSPEKKGKGKSHKFKSVSTHELKDSKQVYPPLPPVPQMVSSSLPPLPPVPPSAPVHPTYLNTTPPLTLSSSLSSSTSSITNPESISLNGSGMIGATTTTTTTTTTTQLGESKSLSALNLTIPIGSVESLSSLSSLSPILKAHNFKSKYFTQPTKCQFCEQFIWGVIGKQGVMCSDCGYTAHKPCGIKVAHSCTSSPPKRVKSSTERERDMLRIHLDKEASSENLLAHSHSGGNSRKDFNINVNNINNSVNNNNSNNNVPTSPTSDGKKQRRSSLDSAVRDFQQFFKSYVPIDETLVTHYSCGYQGSVLKHGRIYLTEHYLCFYDNLVFDKNKQRQKIIPISSIKSIEKKSGLAPNDGSIFNTLKTPASMLDPPLITVIKQNDFEMLLLLLEYYAQNKSDEINQVDKEGYSPLHVAVSSDISDGMLLHILKYASVKVEVKNMDGNTPLHYFCQKFRSPECQKIAQIFIEKGADVNHQNNNGETPLHKAIFNNSVRLLMVYVLLKNNANINLVNSAGESALHYAVHLGRVDVLKTLITAGADPTLVSTKSRKTPLILAEENGNLEIIDLLKRLESSTNVPAITPGAMDLLKELENMDIKNGRWIISQHELEYTDKIGSGISGKVYKGLYRNREVAIKVLKSADEAHNREEFLKEFHVLASLQSSLIVGLYGVVLEPRLLKGVSTLHQSAPQILHRDVKSLNFLVTKDWRIKVADFGLSRFNTKSNQLTLNKTRGTSAYCAPEVFQGKEYSEKSDVYSLGVVFWELIFALINGRYLHPYGEYKKMNEFQIMLYTSNHGLRPTIPTNSPKCIRDLITRCWDKDLEQRPTCIEAIDILAECEREYTQSTLQWNELLQLKDETSKHLSMDSSLSLSSSDFSNH